MVAAEARKSVFQETQTITKVFDSPVDLFNIMPSLQELTGLPEKFIQENLRLEPRHRFAPGEPDNLVFMSPSVALQDDELRYGGPSDWGAREILGRVTKKILEEDSSYLLQVPEITSTHMGYGKRSANKEGRGAITEDEAEDWLRVLKSTKLDRQAMEREGEDISEEIIELPNPQADPEVFEQGPNLISEEDSGLKFCVDGSYFLFFSILLIFFEKKYNHLDLASAQVGPNKISDFLVFWTVPYLLNFSQRKLSEIMTACDRYACEKPLSVKITAEEVIKSACANISSESYREVEDELLEAYRDLYGSDIIAKQYEVLEAPDGSPIILIPLKYQVTKMPAYFEDLGKRKTWKKLGKRSIFRQFMTMFIKDSEIQRDAFRSCEGIGSRQGTDFGFILPNRPTYSAFIQCLQSESRNNVRQLEESPEEGLLKPHCAVLKDSGKNITLAFSYLPDKVSNRTIAAVFRALGATYCDHFTIVILHGALLNTEEPDFKIGKLYPVSTAKQKGKVKKDYIPIRFENVKGKFTEVDFPVTYIKWEEEVRQIPEISRFNLEPEYVFDEQVNCVFSAKNLPDKYKNNLLPGVASAITPRQIRQYKCKVANLNGCTIKFVAKSARKNNVAVLLAINDYVGPVRGTVASRPRIMQLIIRHFLMAVIVAGLPQVYPVSEDQGGAAATLSEGNGSDDSDDDDGDDDDGDNDDGDDDMDESQDVNTGCSSKQPSVEAEEVSDEFLFDLSQKIFQKWEEVAYRLGFEHHEVEGFKEGSTSKLERAKQMLFSWKRSDGKGRGATKGVLATALEESGLSLFAKF